MTKKASLASALLCCFIWGTTFIAQDTGMDNIGPYTFNGVRFMVGFFALLPIFLLIEKKNFTSEFNKDKKKFVRFYKKSCQIYFKRLLDLVIHLTS